jgi:hypothetical protein
VQKKSIFGAGAGARTVREKDLGTDVMIFLKYFRRKNWRKINVFDSKQI